VGLQYFASLLIDDLLLRSETAIFGPPENLLSSPKPKTTYFAKALRRGKIEVLCEWCMFLVLSHVEGGSILYCGNKNILQYKYCNAWYCS
jgi:hypothetical protein